MRTPDAIDRENRNGKTGRQAGDRDRRRQRGRASALLFAREGARVLAVDRSTDAVAQTAAMVGSEGGEAIAMVADAGEESEVKAYVGRALDAFGGLDVVYANAGISGGDVPLFEQEVSAWAEILRVNLIGPFLAIKHAGRHMVAQGSGAIVCTASVAGLRSNAGGSPYSASKAGVISLVQTAANSIWGSGVRVNAVCPGLIETGMTRPIFEYARARGSQDKLGRLKPPISGAAARNRRRPIRRRTRSGRPGC